MQTHSTCTNTRTSTTLQSIIHILSKLELELVKKKRSRLTQLAIMTKHQVKWEWMGWTNKTRRGKHAHIKHTREQSSEVIKKRGTS